MLFRSIAQAKANGQDVVLLDTAGRLAIDQDLMNELKDINTTLIAKPAATP